LFVWGVCRACAVRPYCTVWTIQHSTVVLSYPSRPPFFLPLPYSPTNERGRRGAAERSKRRGKKEEKNATLTSHITHHTSHNTQHTHRTVLYCTHSLSPALVTSHITKPLTSHLPRAVFQTALLPAGCLRTVQYSTVYSTLLHCTAQHSTAASVYFTVPSYTAQYSKVCTEVLCAVGKTACRHSPT
jgi:hypothetical protein